jgi:hypothetical protein
MKMRGILKNQGEAVLKYSEVGFFRMTKQIRHPCLRSRRLARNAG